MTYEYGIYDTVLANTPNTRETLFQLVNKFSHRGDFRALHQSPFEHDPSTLIILQHQLGERDISRLVETHYQRGNKYIEMIFRTKQHVEARPLSSREKVFGAKYEEGAFEGQLHIQFSYLNMHAYTNDPEIGQEMGLIDGVIRQFAPGIERDYRTVWQKLPEYLFIRIPLAMITSARDK